MTDLSPPKPLILPLYNRLYQVFTVLLVVCILRSALTIGQRSQVAPVIRTRRVHVRAHDDIMAVPESHAEDGV